MSLVMVSGDQDIPTNSKDEETIQLLVHWLGMQNL
jgi:hypothetical protein